MKATTALRPGDSVSLVAPAGPVDGHLFSLGCERLSRYKAKNDSSIFSAQRYLAGTDQRRLQELQTAIDNKQIRAIHCARGGYGTLRLLPELSFDLMDKPLIGCSDITALHCALQAKGIISIHGPMVTQLASVNPPAMEDLFQLLENPQAKPILSGKPLVGGIVEGPVIGGNLSVLTRLIGTPYFPSLEGAILFFEDVGERPYRLDRMWQHLRLAGVLEKIVGIAMGTFVGCNEPGDGMNASWSAEQILSDLVSSLGITAVIGLPVGHGNDNRPIPLGARARLDGNKGTLAFLEGAVR